MKRLKFLPAITASALALMAAGAQAGMVSDAHGNVGYDTAAECDAAVHNGTARFYQSATHKKPLLRKGERKVATATIRDLGPQYALGACDMGVGHKFGRDGVARALQGKYVPYSPDMPVNVYSDASGRAVRVSMQQCDNRFSDNAPRPVAPMERQPEPVVAPEPQPVVEPAPEPAPEPKASSGIRPYVFGTLGALQDGYKYEKPGYTESESNTRTAGQIGAGVQFNNLLGAELYYQGGDKHRFDDGAGGTNKVQNHTYGGRVTVGGDIGEKLSLFCKDGVAGVKHKLKDTDGNSYSFKTKARPTLGIGGLYKFTENLGLRADYDYYFRKKEREENGEKFTWKGNHYVGAGVQYTF